MKNLFLKLYIIFSLLHLQAFAEINLSEFSKSKNATQSSEFYIDKSLQYTLKDVRENPKLLDWQKIEARDLSLGLFKGNFFSRVVVHNDTNQDVKIYLLITFPHLDKINFSDEKNDLEIYRIAHKSVSDPSKYFVLSRVPSSSVTFKPNETKTIYVELSNAGLANYQLFLVTEHGLDNRSVFEMVLYSGYTGIMIVMIVFFSIFSILVRERKYIYYVLYTIAFLLMVGFVENLHTPIFASSQTDFSWLHITSCSTFIFFIKFAEYFLELEKKSPVKKKIIDILVFIFVIQMFWGIVVKRGSVEVVGSILTAIATILVSFFAFQDFKTSRNARFFFFATLISVAVVVLFSTHIMGLEDFESLEHSLLIISATEIIILGIGLADTVTQLNLFLEDKNETLQRLNSQLVTEIQQKEEAQKEIVHQHSIFVENERMRVMGEMAATIVHEIKNPLFGIQLWHEQLKKVLTDGETSSKISPLNILEKIEVNSDRVNKIIASITQLSRNESVLPFEEKDLRPLIEECCELMKQKAILSNTKLHFEPIKDSAIVKHRPSQIFQIIINLMSNAINALSSLDEERKVTVSLIEDENSFKIMVTNTGPRVSAALIDEVFEKGGMARSAKSGAGIGLRVSKSLAEKHNGKLYLDTSFALTTFVLSLPKP